MDLNLSEIAKAIKVNYNDIKFAFLIGSRLWGTAREESDYDLLLVLKNYKSEQTVSHVNNCDIIILGSDIFEERLRNQEFIETICTYLPHNNILKSSDVLKRITIDPNKWYKSVMYRMERDMEYSTKNIIKGKIDRAYKTRFHTLVTLTMGILLLKQGHLKNDDFSAAAKYKELLINDDNFYEIYRKLLKKFQDLYQSKLNKNKTTTTKN